MDFGVLHRGKGMTRKGKVTCFVRRSTAGELHLPHGALCSLLQAYSMI